MLLFFRYLKAGIFLLAALSPVSVAIILQVELADGNFLTDESFLKVETSLGWSDYDVFQSQADGTVTVFPALKSTTQEDFAFITLPAGIASVTCSGLLQVDGSAGIACLDCGDSSLAVASVFNSNSSDSAGKEAGLFEFPTMDPFVPHNLTIINDGATNTTSLILTHLSLNVTTLVPSTTSPLNSMPASTSASRTTQGAISPTPPPLYTSTSGYYGSNTSYTDPTDTSSSSSSDAHGGLNPQQIIAIVISTVIGTSVLGLAIFVLYFTRFRRTRRQSGIISSTSPPGDAMRASALTSAPSPITPSVDARLASLFPRRTSRPRSSPTSRRSAASQRSFTRQVPQLPLPALWRQSIQRSASMDQMLPDAEAPNDIDFIHIPRVSSPSLFSIVTDPDPDMSVPPLDPHGSASTLSSSTERGGHFPLRMNTRSPTADREDEPRSLRQTSAGDPVLPRGLPSPGRPPSPSVYSLGPSSVSGGFQRLSSELRWSRGYPETFHGSSE